MAASLLITLREGLEAALIVGIVLAYLARTGNREQFKNVWAGVLGAVAVSLLTGAIVFTTAGSLDEKAEEIFEGIAMLIAVGILTYMVFWMRKISRHIRKELEDKINAALEIGSTFALASLVFVAVLREGLETVLFMFSVARTSTPLASATGGVLGLALAVFLGYSLYKGSKLLDLRAFFNVTSILLILFAAGLLAHGIHELQEVSTIPVVIEHVWDINFILNEKGLLGSFLNALFGYNGNPSLIEALSYATYLIWASWFYLQPSVFPKAQAPARN